MAQSAQDMAQSVSHAAQALVARFSAAQARRASEASTAPPVRLGVALSGGRDSMVLLDSLHRACVAGSAGLRAIHVNHGLSPNADAWARFCADECAGRGVPLKVERVRVEKKGGDSVEALARSVRLQALLACELDVLVLAHHADDQAETLLLQLLRGAGPHGLAAMPHQSTRRGGPVLVRPFLDLTPRALAAYAQLHGLRWIDDESNTDTRFRRNALRHRVTPLLREIAPGYPATLVRAARHQAEAASLLDELAQLDAAGIAREHHALGRCLDRAALAALAEQGAARARNVLRWFLREHGLPAPSSARLAQMLAQCTTDRADAKIAIRHAGAHIALHDGRIVIHRAATGTAYSLAWRGEARVDCPGGTLHATCASGVGIAAPVVASGRLRVASRAGGERLRVAPNRPQQAVSALFNHVRTPLWQRQQWPLVWHDDVLVAVPGLAMDPSFRATPDTPGFELRWTPAM